MSGKNPAISEQLISILKNDRKMSFRQKWWKEGKEQVIQAASVSILVTSITRKNEKLEEEQFAASEAAHKPCIQMDNRSILILDKKVLKCK